jgi:hypothetical protein
MFLEKKDSTFPSLNIVLDKIVFPSFAKIKSSPSGIPFLNFFSENLFPFEYQVVSIPLIL